MRVLSLFDGCSCAMQALKNLGIKPDVYYASEVDKYAIQISKKNHPEIIHLGDVREITKEIIPGKIDLMVWGSPCQDLSAAGKQKGLSGEKSGLFFEAVRLLKEVKPKYFLMENVASMKDSDKKIISDTLGVEPIMINSALLSAQQRKRYYWTNIPNVNLPDDRKIYLKDILESGEVDREKSRAIISSIDRTTEREYFRKNQGQMVFDKSQKILNVNPSGRGQNGNVYDVNAKSPTVTTNKGEGVKNLDRPERIGSVNDSNSQGNRIYSINGKSITLQANSGGVGSNTGLYLDPICVASRGRNLVEGKRKDIKGAKTEQRLEPRFDGKTNCLTTVQKDNFILDNYVIRKLTPIECERLQTLPDGYSSGVSNTQRYKILGNGFTVAIIEHIFKSLLS